MTATKETIKLALLLFFFINSNMAQSIKPIGEFGDTKNGFYYKDQLDVLNPYVGTWKYINGTKVLIIKFKKIVNHHVITGSTNQNYHADIIVGGYQYFENGIELLNTMNQLNTNLPNIYDYNLCMAHFISYHAKPRCFNCDPNIMRLAVGYSETARPNLTESERTYIGIKDGDRNKLIFSKGSFYWGDVPGNLSDEPILPDAVYELTKIAP